MYSCDNASNWAKADRGDQQHRRGLGTNRVYADGGYLFRILSHDPLNGSIVLEYLILRIWIRGSA